MASNSTVQQPKEEDVCAEPALATSLFQALEEHQREAAQWLEKHHEKLRSAVELACRSTASTGSFELKEGWASSPQLQEKAQLPQHKEEKASLRRHLTAWDLEEDSGGSLQSEHASQRSPLTGSPPPEKAQTSQDRQENIAAAPSGAINSESSPPTSRKSMAFRMMISEASAEQHHPRSRFLQQITDKRTSFNEKPSNGPGRSLRARLEVVLQGRFDVFIGSLIILNTVVMFAELEIQGRSDAELWAFSVLRHSFNLIFFLELVLKFYVLRCWFWYSLFNVLDFAIVFITIVDAYILTHVGSDFSSAQIMRLVRFARLVRMLRVIRTLELFQQLRVLLSTIAVSYMSLFWSMVVLFIFMLTSSLILCQMLQDFIVDTRNDESTRLWVQNYYGTSSRSLYSVFELTFSGCWPNYARTLIEEVNGWFTVFFVIYVTGVVFAMIRIISALFLKDTLQAAANDADFVVQEKQSEVKTFVAKLSDLFREADKNADGFLSKQELDEVLSYPKVKLWMNVIGLDVSDTVSLFNVLAGDDGKVSSEEFVKGIMRLKGTARSQDIVVLMRDCDRLLKECGAVKHAIEALESKVRERVKNRRQESLPLALPHANSGMCAKILPSVWRCRSESSAASQRV